MTELLPLSQTTNKIHPLLAFRIVAWKACYFADERWKLGPKYHCPTCDLKEKDLANGCPKCPLTDLLNSAFKGEAKDEITHRGGMPDGYSLDDLIKIYVVVSQILSENEDKINPQWSVTFTEFAKIIMQERAQMKYAYDWNQWKAMQGK